MILADQYLELSKKFEDQVVRDNKYHNEQSLFLPNVTPTEPVDFILIGAEPSKGNWCPNDTDGRLAIEFGFRNFRGCWECTELHHCIHKYLCQGQGTFYLTDLAKGAIRGHNDKKKKWLKYERWYDLLIEELALVAKPDATIISIGGTTAHFLNTKGLHGHVGTVPHYSKSTRNHGKYIPVYKEQWEKFNRTLTRLPNGKEIKPSDKKWMFDYKILFERFRPGGKADWRGL